MPSRVGATLLEVVVAMTILVVAGTGSVSLVSQALRAADEARRMDREVRAASEFMGAVSLWPREDLDRRLGNRRQGPWTLRIERQQSSVYHATLTDTLTGRPLIRTALFRPEIRRDRR